MKELLWLIAGAAWLTGLFTSVSHGQIMMILLDFFIPPMSVII
jgi:hypothetical protein